jgi:hypothetical protein
VGHLESFDYGEAHYIQNPKNEKGVSTKSVHDHHCEPQKTILFAANPPQSIIQRTEKSGP